MDVDLLHASSADFSVRELEILLEVVQMHLEWEPDDGDVVVIETRLQARLAAARGAGRHPKA